LEASEAVAEAMDGVVNLTQAVAVAAVVIEAINGILPVVAKETMVEMAAVELS
jgi:hypothetical protein